MVVAAKTPMNSQPCQYFHVPAEIKIIAKKISSRPMLFLSIRRVSWLTVFFLCLLVGQACCLSLSRRGILPAVNMNGRRDVCRDEAGHRPAPLPCSAAVAGCEFKHRLGASFCRSTN